MIGCVGMGEWVGGGVGVGWECFGCELMGLLKVGGGEGDCFNIWVVRWVHKNENEEAS